MEISELWPFVKVLTVIAVAGTIIHLAKPLQRRLFRRVIRLAASCVLIVSFGYIFLLLFATLLFTKHSSPVYSPNGQHVAVISYALQGALGDDYANVIVRPWWRPWGDSVYSGLGKWNFREGKPSDPEVRWIDQSNLLIRYYDDRTGNEGRGGPAICCDRIGSIQIVCQPLR